MAFSSSTVTHTFENGDGTAASGSLTFTLTGRMTNGSTTIVPAPVTSTLNASGQLSVALLSNSDTGTTPTGVQWRVDIRILGLDPETFFITVPVGPGTVDLGSLLPSAPQVA